MTDDLQTERLDDALVPPRPRESDASASASDAPATVEASVAAATPSVPDPRPRTRWAGIVWGLVLAAVASLGIWLASGEGRVEELVEWMRGLTAATAIGYSVLAIGAILLIVGVVGLLRRAQRALTRSRS